MVRSVCGFSYVRERVRKGLNAVFSRSITDV